MTQAGIELRLSLRRPDFELNLDLDLPGQGVTVFFGPSGSGKTTLLRCLAGLEPNVRGVLRVGDERWLDSARGLHQPTHQRALGYVFQEPSLFPHLSVRQNLAYGLKRAGTASSQKRQAHWIELLGLDDLLDRDPAQLSGGERQRVALARALATEPRVLLLDEPLASLDPQRRSEVMPWLLRLREELPIPMLYVTHSVEELTRLGDHLVWLQAGQARLNADLLGAYSQLGPPALPEHEQGALLCGEVRAIDPQWHMAEIDFAGASLWVSDLGLTPGHLVRVRLLARDLSVVTAPPQHTSIQNHWPVVIEAVEDTTHPSQRLLRLRHAAGVLLARVTQRACVALDLSVGRSVWAQVKSVAVLRQ